MPVQVPLEKGIGIVVDVCALDTGGDRSAVISASDLDVESLGPELSVGDSAVVVDGCDFSTEHVIAAWDALGDSDALLVVIVVEDGVSAPVAGLLLGLTLRVAAGAVVDEGALVDLEEAKLGLVDLGAVAVAWGEVGGGPAVMAAVPADFVTAARALVGPGESDGLAGRSFNSVWGGRSVLVGNHVRVGELVAVDGSIASALVGPPGRRLVLGVDLGGLVVAGVRLAASIELHDASVGGHGGEEGGQDGASLEDLRHGGFGVWGDLKRFVL